MPIYEYRCNECGAVSEYLTGIEEGATVTCQSCGSLKMEKIMSAPSFLSHAREQAPGDTCCGREERCETPPCSTGGTCRRD